MMNHPDLDPDTVLKNNEKTMEKFEGGDVVRIIDHANVSDHLVEDEDLNGRAGTVVETNDDVGIALIHHPSFAVNYSRGIRAWWVGFYNLEKC